MISKPRVHKDIYNWNNWWAWHPVRVYEHGGVITYRWVWLETVERRRLDGDIIGEWRYRLKHDS